MRSLHCFSIYSKLFICNIYHINHQVGLSIMLTARGWINIKITSYQYRKSHCGDKTILRPSYLHNGISYTDKITSLYWIRALVCNRSSVLSCAVPWCDKQSSTGAWVFDMFDPTWQDWLTANEGNSACHRIHLRQKQKTVMLIEIKGAVSLRFSQGLTILMCINLKLKADTNFLLFVLCRHRSKVYNWLHNFMI